MAIKQLNPYVIFNGEAGDAIKLYEQALGAHTENLMRYGDVPGNQTPEPHRQRVIHARLHIGDGVLMLGDAPADMRVPTQANVHISLDFTDAAEMARTFEALGAGGKVTQPLHDTFWGARFGMLVDRFGIGWMFNCMKEASK